MGKRKQCPINRYASVLYRCSRPYYDRTLKEFGISSGSQFFLHRISERPGLPMAELAENGRFDKGTTNRAVKKLEKQGYVTIEIDQDDRRLHKLYLTEKAYEVLEASYVALDAWHNIITQGLSPDEVREAESLMKRVADNAYEYERNLRDWK